MEQIKIGDIKKCPQCGKDVDYSLILEEDSGFESDFFNYYCDCGTHMTFFDNGSIYVWISMSSSRDNIGLYKRIRKEIKESSDKEKMKGGIKNETKNETNAKSDW